MEFIKQKSIYMQIVDYFHENILTERWKGGEKVPSVRQLAIDLEVNPNTVMRTYTHLQDNNIITNQRGIGFFVSEDAKAIVQEQVKDQFITEELPALFGTMELLGMECRAIEAIYETWKSTQKQNI
jgi:GntR family transcriptional regulator